MKHVHVIERFFRLLHGHEHRKIIGQLLNKPDRAALHYVVDVFRLKRERYKFMVGRARYLSLNNRPTSQFWVVFVRG